MIFTGEKIKETKNYPMALGFCPICSKSAEIVQSASEIPHPHTHLCSNEYYRHYVDEKGNTYVRKVRNPKAPMPK